MAAGDYTFVSKDQTSRGAYRDSKELVVRPGAQLPDTCIACGKKAWGNLIHKDLPEVTVWLLLPSILGPMANAAAKFRFAFPFCPNCPPEGPYFTAKRVDKHLAVIHVSCGAFLEAFPPMPPDVAAEKNLSWFRRRFRWFHQ